MSRKSDLEELRLNVTGLEEPEVKALLGISKLINLAKGERFIEAGQIPRYMGFVVNGLFRYVYLDDEGNEFTKNFLSENSFITSYSAMVQQQPSWFSIEALEDSEILKFDFLSWKNISQNNSHWDRFLLRMLEKAFIIKEKRERELLLLDAESRYRIFRDEFPGLDKRVKQHIIASYLGIKPESLSRIRKQAALT